MARQRTSYCYSYAPLWSLAGVIHVSGRVVPVIFHLLQRDLQYDVIVFNKTVHNIRIGGCQVLARVCLCCAWVMKGDTDSGHFLLPAPAFFEGTLVLAYICSQ
jgi:hypothetical protein